VVRKRRGKSDEKIFSELGKRVAALIKEKGYKSPYVFWLEHGDEGLSRSNLNYILNGKSDPKLSTLRRIAEGLEIDISELLKEI
jgi:transcriptional regulator with XRE-family HTH domain